MSREPADARVTGGPWLGWSRWVIIAWVVVIVLLAVRGYLQPRKNSVYPIYHRAALVFAQGGEVYGRPDPTQGIDVYRYPPCATPLFLPLAVWDERIASALWRLLQGAFLLASTWLLSRKLGDCLKSPQAQSDAGQALFLAVSLVLSVSSLNNGQINCLVSACLVFGLFCALTGRWSIAGVFLAIATLFKIFPIALFLLLVLVAPLRFSLAFVGALAFLVGWPFVVFEGHFLVGQYRACASFLGGDGRHHWPIEAGYRDLWMLLRLVGWNIPVATYQTIQLGLGLLCAIGVLWLRWTRRSPQVEVDAYLVGVSWMMLCGPSTESSTYTLLAPVLGLAAVLIAQKGTPPVPRGLFLLGIVLALFCALAPAFPRGTQVQVWGLQPLGTLFLVLGWVWLRLSPEPSWEASGQETDEPNARTPWDSVTSAGGAAA